MLKILIASDAYKGSLSAKEACNAIAEGFSHALPEADILQCPIADGGEGTLDCLLEKDLVRIEKTEALNPLGEKIQASVGYLEDNTAIIEMAQASGLTLIPKEKRHVFHASSFGTGQLILKALESGSQRIIVTLGGSACCDAGIGVLAALGMRLLDRQGQTVSYTAEGLSKLHKIDNRHLDPRLKDCEILATYDVNNPLLGLEGALMYAAQKGASPEEIEILHKNLEHFSDLITEVTGKNVGEHIGGGSGGGLGASLHAFLNAELIPGADWILEQLKMKNTLQNVNLVVTGEGQIDRQSAQGKAPVAIAKLAKTLDIPVIGIAARLGKGYYETYQHGIDAVFSMVNGPISEQTCLLFTKPLLVAAANNVARLIACQVQK